MEGAEVRNRSVDGCPRPQVPTLPTRSQTSTTHPLRSSTLSSTLSSTPCGSSYTKNHARRKSPAMSLTHTTHHNTFTKRSPIRPSPFIFSSGSTFKLALALVFLVSLDGTLARRTKCILPSTWKGEWFISGLTKPVIVNDTALSHKGGCVQNYRDRYLIKNPDYGCYRCLVIHQKHHNVLQYKETYCHKSNDLEEVCSLLAADALLYSLFRFGADPVPCPFQHNHVFTYNRGHGECSFPPSAVVSCIEDWRVLFRYQACPDVQGTESKSEELVCLAVWKEGSKRYLVGKSDHPLATSDEDRYRCFVYDTWTNESNSGFKVAQSGDATCNGLFSVYDGSRRLTLTKVDLSGSECIFPKWAGGTHWHSLDGGTSFHLTKRNSTLKLAGHLLAGGPATHSCYNVESSNRTSAVIVTKVMSGCNSGYQCIQLISRDSHVIELKFGRFSQRSRPQEACGHQYFDVSSKNFATFVSGKAESRNCPVSGHYEVLGGTMNSVGGAFQTHGREGMAPGSCEQEAFKALSVGCSSSDTLEIHTTCSKSEYSCHGWWEESGWQYLVVTPVSRTSKGARRLCLVIDRGEEIFSLASSSQTCIRDLLPGHNGRIALNSTSTGRCEAATIGNGASSISPRKSANVLLDLYSWFTLSLPIFASLHYRLR